MTTAATTKPNKPKLKLGFTLWILAAPVLYVISPNTFLMTMIHHIILFAMLILLPMGLHILEGKSYLYQPLANTLQKIIIPFALITLIAMVLPVCPQAGFLTLPWLLFTGLVSLSGLSLLWQKRKKLSLTTICYGCKCFPMTT